jgi:putative polyhydroxyalkanoate system protein
MGDIRVEKSHQLSIEAAKKALEPFAAELESKYGLKLSWNGARAELKGTGASGTVDVSTSKVVVSVKLGMLAKAAGIKAEKVQSSIDKRLSAALEPASGA